jgi:hypothetical protein
MLKKRKNTGPCMTFFPHYLITIVLLISCCYYYSSSSSSPTTSYSEQEARAQKITATTKSTAAFSHSTILSYHVQIPTLGNNFIIYKNPIYGIKIQYPSDWKKIEYYNTPLTVGGSNLVVNFLAPLINGSEHWRAHLMIQVLKQNQAKKLIPQSQITIGDRHGFKSLHNTSMQIFNIDRNTESNLQIKTMDVWVSSSNGDTYLLTYKAVMAQYEDYVPTVQKMIDSFRVENSTFVNNPAIHSKSK